jgi:hypothetical protein
MGTGFLAGECILEQLIAVLHGARAGDQHHAVTAYLYAIQGEGRILRDKFT